MSVDLLCTRPNFTYPCAAAGEAQVQTQHTSHQYPMQHATGNQTNKAQGVQTCMRRTAMPTELSSSVRKAAPRLEDPGCTTSACGLPFAAPTVLSCRAVHTSQATNSSSVRTPMTGGCWLTADVAGGDAGVALPVCAASLPFAAAPPAGVTTWQHASCGLVWLDFTIAPCDVHLRELLLWCDLRFLACSVC